MRAAACGDEAAVRALLAHGASVNAAGRAGVTALVAGSLEGHEGILKVLLQNGADPELRQRDDATALAIATKGGRSKVVHEVVEGLALQLVDAGGDPRRPSAHDMPPIDVPPRAHTPPSVRVVPMPPPRGR